MARQAFVEAPDLLVHVYCDSFKPTVRNPGGGFVPSPDQERALDTLYRLLSQRDKTPGKRTILVLSGYAGAGKSTVMKLLIERVEADGQEVVLLAPTGKAAARLAETTGRKTSTVHGFIYGAPTTVGTCPSCEQDSPDMGLTATALRKQGLSKWTCPHCSATVPMGLGTQIERKMGFAPKSKKKGEEEAKTTPATAIIDEACLPYTQRVMLADGSWRYIGQLVEERSTAEVLSYNTKTGVIEPKRITNWFKYEKTPDDDLLEIRASVAKNRERLRIVRCTKRHKIYTDRGEVPAGDLRVGDKVHVKGTFFDDAQLQIAIGSVFGDGHLSNQAEVLRITQGEAQLDYLRWKSRALGCEHTIYKGTSGYGGLPIYHATTRRVDTLVGWRERVYRDSKRTVVKSLLDQMQALGLAIWFMDDGSTSVSANRKPSACFHTERYSSADCEILREYLLNKWGLETTLIHYRHRWMLRLRHEATLRLFSIIRPWVHPDCGYKIGEKITIEPELSTAYKDQGLFEIQEITPWKMTARKHVFDIEVEDNHNYYAGNVLVSNSMVDVDLAKDITTLLHPRYAVLYVGDKGQLPPVKGGWGADFEHPTAELTQVHRQAADNPIINLVTRIRQKKNRRDLFEMDVPGRDRVVIDRRSSMQQAAAWLADMRAKRQDATLITYTNKKRQALNQGVRKLRAPVDPRLGRSLEEAARKEQLAVIQGDRALMRSNNRPLELMNGEVLIVSNAWHPEGKLCQEGFQWVEFYKRNGPVLVRKDLVGPGRNGEIIKYDEWADEMKPYTSEIRRFERELDSIQRGFESSLTPREEAKANDMLSLGTEELFDMYGAIRPADLLHIDYGECVTAHTSQGSQWKNVGVVWDYSTEQLYYKGSDKDPEEGLRWAYTAFTRASERLFIFVVQ